jgi:hypothetical protein
MEAHTHCDTYTCWLYKCHLFPACNTKHAKMRSCMLIHTTYIHTYIHTCMHIQIDMHQAYTHKLTCMCWVLWSSLDLHNGNTQALKTNRLSCRIDAKSVQTVVKPSSQSDGYYPFVYIHILCLCIDNYTHSCHFYTQSFKHTDPLTFLTFTCTQHQCIRHTHTHVSFSHTHIHTHSLSLTHM